MAIRIISRKDIEEEEEKKRLARFYTRRERYQQAFRDLGLIPLWEEVRKMERKLNIHFDKDLFWSEVNNPHLCTII